MSFDFTGKRVLVAGGSRGIGRAIALHFAAAGADVALCARGAATLEEARADIARSGHRVHAMRTRPSNRSLLVSTVVTNRL